MPNQEQKASKISITSRGCYYVTSEQGSRQRITVIFVGEPFEDTVHSFQNSLFWHHGRAAWNSMRRPRKKYALNKHLHQSLPLRAFASRHQSLPVPLSSSAGIQTTHVAHFRNRRLLRAIANRNAQRWRKTVRYVDTLLERSPDERFREMGASQQLGTCRRDVRRGNLESKAFVEGTDGAIHPSHRRFCTEKDMAVMLLCSHLRKDHCKSGKYVPMTIQVPLTNNVE